VRACDGDGASCGLVVDLYELTMAESYLAEGMESEPATFSLFTRSLPPGWGFLLAAGLGGALAALERLSFAEDDLAYLESTCIFDGRFLDHLRGVRFRGTVRAMQEGTAFFADEPVLEVDAALLEAQLVETAVLNAIQFASLAASKAARCVEAADGRTLVDFAMRRTHGVDAALTVARSAWIAGFDATSDVLAGKRLGIPIAGTVAHSHVQSFADELDAFRAFARAFPERCMLLVDTYDTGEGLRRAAIVGRELAARGVALRGVRLDSGDLAEASRQARRVLDDAGLVSTTVFASGGLDEREIARLVSAGAPIDGFGVGSRLGTSADAPYLDMAYKLVSAGGRPTLKLSAGKATWPGAKQVFRRSGEPSRTSDEIALAGEDADGREPLLRTVMRDGRRTDAGREPLAAARERTARQRRLLPSALRSLDAEPVVVSHSAALQALRDEVAGTAGARAERTR
jgi:nicotinate phosphoribosyltransferase